MAAIARRQHGVVSVAQLRACGLTDEAVRGLTERGELRRLHRSVYVFGPIVTQATGILAAVLACGPGAVATHHSAAYLYGILPYPARPGPVHVTVPDTHRRGDRGIVVHETARLNPHETRERHNVPVTSPIRTLIDLAGVCDEDELEQAVAEVFALRFTNRAALLRATKMSPRRRGVGRLRALLDGNPARTRSTPERILLRAIRAARLPEPETNVKLGGWEVDFLWRDAGLVVEVDAYSTHSSPRAFERDRRKDAELATQGISVQRFSAERVRSELEAVIEWIDVDLGRRLTGASSSAA